MAASAGLELDPWQAFVLAQSLGEQPDGRWAAFEVGLVVPRQNGKGSILEARELAGLYLLGEGLITHSAHEFKTAQEHFRRILMLIESNPDLDRRVKKVSRSHGDEGIELKSGQRLRFMARSRGAGRGFSGDCVVLDEAFDLPDAAIGAIMPTMSARPNPQMWYASSAVDQTEHPNGLVLARVRERALAGEDPSLAFFEWSVDPDRYYEDPGGVACDPAAWAESNPGLGIRISAEHVSREQRSMDPRTFATERLSVGDWPSTDPEADRVIPGEVWGRLEDPDVKMVDPVAFAVDVTPDRKFAAVAAAGRSADGRKVVEIVKHSAGVGWVVPYLLGRVEKWSPCAVVVDGRGPAASLIPELEEGGLSRKPDGVLMVASTGDVAQACGSLFDAAFEGTLAHAGQQSLDAALAAAKQRTLGDAWAWARKGGGDISPLVAATMALHGHAVHGRDAAPVPMVF